jgi:hypothetical protein
MKKIREKMIRISVATLAGLSFLIFAAVPTFALRDGSDDGTGGSGSGSNKLTTVEQQKTETETETEHSTTTTKTDSSQHEGEHGKLNQIRLKSCDAHEKAINNIMQRISARGANQIGVFNKIAERVEAFYTKNNLTVSNYQTLVNAVNTQKAAAQAAIDQVKSTSVTFKCDGSDPQGVGTIFKQNVNNEITALKNYKTAVKNLLVAVKTAADASSTGGQQ